MSLEDFLKWMERRGATLTVREESGDTVLRIKCPCRGEVAHSLMMVSEYDKAYSLAPVRALHLEEMMRGLDNLTLEPAWPTKST